MSNFARVTEAVQSLARGEVIIVLDSDDREDEGDFLIAAEKVTPQLVHFMISEGRGQLCVPVSLDLAKRLALSRMVCDSDKDLPGFTIPVDHRSCKTGISPLERCRTIQFLVDERSRAEDFVRPGHIFPLIARPGGVLERPGHTEAAVELARLAGLSPAGVLCEICSRDGLHMADRSELLERASDLGLCVVTIDALIEFVKQSPKSRETNPSVAELPGSCATAIP